jgi:hypothetical protein
VWQGIDGKRWEAVKTFLEGQEVEITIGRRRKRRSLAQNSYYWGVVVEAIAEAAGYSTAEEAHDALRLHFLEKHRDGQMPTIRSTAELTTVEFEDYVAKCRQLGAEMFGIYIPDPLEVPEQ